VGKRIDTSPDNIDRLVKAYKHELIERDMSVRELAKELDINETYLGCCLNFSRISENTDNIRRKAYAYLGISEEGQ
jgi:YesN/AraC family two-component response regulator